MPEADIIPTGITGLDGILSGGIPRGNVVIVTGSPGTGKTILRLHILVIEDNADTRSMLRSMLELQGHRVDVAEDGPRGVEIARAVRPDVAVVDIGLPGLDGYEVGHRIRGDRGSAVRLIALTGYSRAEDRKRSPMKHGV